MSGYRWLRAAQVSGCLLAFAGAFGAMVLAAPGSFWPGGPLMVLCFVAGMWTFMTAQRKIDRDRQAPREDAEVRR